MAAIIVAGVLIAGAIVFARFLPINTDPYAELRVAVAKRMLDPESARFREIKEKIKDFSYCGEVNGKNRMGGYVGFKKFYAMKHTQGNYLVMFDEHVAEEMCKDKP